MVDAIQPDLANQSPHLGGEAAHQMSRCLESPFPQRWKAPLAWGVGGSDGVLLRQVVCGG